MTDVTEVGQRATPKFPIESPLNQSITLVPGDVCWVVMIREDRVRVRCPELGYDGWSQRDLWSHFPDADDPDQKPVSRPKAEPLYDREAHKDMDERTGHVWYVCKVDHDGRLCQFCDGGLGHCTVCNGFEGTLTSQCCGAPLSHSIREAVYAGAIDYNNSRWWLNNVALNVPNWPELVKPGDDEPPGGKQ